VVAVRKDFRTVRPMCSVAAGREDRPQRATRLSPVQRLAQIIENVRRWVLAHGQHEEKKQPALTEADKQSAKVELTEDTKQAEKISFVPSQTPRVRPNIKLNVPPPRRSRGIGI
jgi:hypothetical protein